MEKSALLIGERSEVELRVILAACASAKGFHAIGDRDRRIDAGDHDSVLDDWRHQ